MGYWYGRDIGDREAPPRISPGGGDVGGTDVGTTDAGEGGGDILGCRRNYQDCLAECRTRGDDPNCRNICNQERESCLARERASVGQPGAGAAGGACGQGAGPAFEGCGCGKFFNCVNDADPCPPGYVKVARAEGGQRCECQSWCTSIGYAADCTTKMGAGGQGALGEFGWPEEMKGLYGSLIKRANELLGMPLGWSEEAKAAQFGREFEKIRGQEKGTRQSLLDALSGQGMLGTGAGIKALGDLAWGTEKNITDLSRDLFVTGELQKKKDIQDYTSLANTLFGQGMNYSQIQEAINAARRGEGALSLQLLLQLLGQMGELA